MKMGHSDPDGEPMPPVAIFSAAAAPCAASKAKAATMIVPARITPPNA